MSHYVEVKLQFKDQGALVEALEAVFSKGAVEVHAQPEAIDGYQGRKGEPCHVIIRKRIAGGLGDIGFRRDPDGTFSQFLDEYDRSIVKALPQRYAVVVATKQARLSGFAVKEEQAKDGRVKLVLSKWGA